MQSQNEQYVVHPSDARFYTCPTATLYYLTRNRGGGKIATPAQKYGTEIHAAALQTTADVLEDKLYLIRPIGLNQKTITKIDIEQTIETSFLLEPLYFYYKIPSKVFSILPISKIDFLRTRVFWQGTPDIVIHDGDKQIIVDLKTGSGSPGDFAQLGLYSALLQLQNNMQSPNYPYEAYLLTQFKAFHKPWVQHSYSSEQLRHSAEASLLNLISNITKYIFENNPDPPSHPSYKACKFCDLFPCKKFKIPIDFNSAGTDDFELGEAALWIQLLDKWIKQKSKGIENTSAVVSMENSKTLMGWKTRTTERVRGYTTTDFTALQNVIETWDATTVLKYINISTGSLRKIIKSYTHLEHYWDLWTYKTDIPTFSAQLEDGVVIDPTKGDTTDEKPSTIS